MSDDYDHSVTQLFTRLKAGDSDAAERLWDVYFQALVREARQRLRGLPRRVSDEEDVALSVFRKLCEGAQSGRFDQIGHRADLWRLLVCVTKDRVADHARHGRRAKRGGGQVRGESVFLDVNGCFSPAGIQQVAGDAPTPEFLAVMAETQQWLLDRLENESLREVARLRFDGHSNEEISEKIDVSLRSVERKLQVIRSCWSRLLGNQSSA